VIAAIGELAFTDEAPIVPSSDYNASRALPRKRGTGAAAS
jgi:hypothetical protein